MKETKFTKGPWNFWMHENKKLHGLSYLQIIHIGPEGVEKICQFDCLHDLMPQSEKDSILANVALIAAAPDMYAMLEAIAKEMGDCRILLRGQSIQDLLAKARGEE
jgi:hypothetical protein